MIRLKNVKKTLFIILLISFAFLHTSALAVEVRIENPLSSDTLEELIDNIINFIFWVATALAPLMIVIAGFYFITAGGEPAKLQTAKNIILYTVIGYSIILFSKGLILVIKQILGA